jgi:hypothetical protein
MALGAIQALTEMSTTHLPGGEKRPARQADNFAAICEPNVCKFREPQPPRTLRATTACTGIALPLPFTSQEIRYVSATKPNRLMLFRETVTVYCENHTEHTNALCGQPMVFKYIVTCYSLTIDRFWID